MASDITDTAKTKKDATQQSVDFPDGGLHSDDGWGPAESRKGLKTAVIPSYVPVETIESPGMIRKQELQSEDIFY